MQQIFNRPGGTFPSSCSTSETPAHNTIYLSPEMDDNKAPATMHVEHRDADKVVSPSGRQALDYEDEADAHYAVGLKTMLAITALSLANCCATLSNTTNTIIKFQIISVGGAAEASWIANGNFLLTLACGPIFGSLADRLGKKWFIVGGCAIGIVGSFISSSGKDVYTIIGGNILVGIAVGLHYSASEKRHNLL